MSEEKLTPGEIFDRDIKADFTRVLKRLEEAGCDFVVNVHVGTSEAPGQSQTVCHLGEKPSIVNIILSKVLEELINGAGVVSSTDDLEFDECRDPEPTKGQDE